MSHYDTNLDKNNANYVPLTPLTFLKRANAAKVSTLLKDFGIEVHSGIARTGVVGILKKGNSSKSIGIRADMDALPIKKLMSLIISLSLITECMHVDMTVTLLCY